MMDSKKKQTIHFTKMHGAGNDYIYVNVMENPVADPVRAAIAWSDRHKGIGSDGLVLIDASPIPEADYSMRIFNADGSEAMMCGNASRCIGKYLYERGLTTQTQIRLLTKSGIKTLHLNIAQPLPSHQGEGFFDLKVQSGRAEQGVGSVTSVTVDMGEPQLENDEQFVTSQGLNQGVFVSMGNPHYVIFTENVDQVGETGRILEHHPAFPQRCNIEFAAPQPPEGGAATPPSGGWGAFRVRVWERGSGITQACGTGACATAVAAALTGRAGRSSQIIMDGGTLSIEWRESDNHVYMTGPAEFVFDGEIELVD